jgi:F0F1-type ATP synthase membrane subunit b/b'
MAPKEIGVEVDTVLTRLETLVRDARAVPMSASAIIHRDEVLDLIEAVRRALPDQLDKAQQVLSSRDAVIAEGRDQAKALIDQAYEERTRLVGQEEVTRQAEIEAERIVHEAELEADRMRTEIDDYVDGKLANFEIVLQDTMAAVERGRDRIHGRRAAAELGRQDEPVPGAGPDEDGSGPA